MEFVKVPLNIAQRAARAYHPIMPYVRKYIAERRNEMIEPTELESINEVIEPSQVADLGNWVASEYNNFVAKVKSMTKEELTDLAKSKGLKKIRGLDKEALIKRILE